MTLVAALAPEPTEAAELDGDALRRWLAARYALPGDRWARLNLVTGIGGQITGPSGTSADLTGGIDRVLLGVLRRSADAVLVGAGTARRERTPLPAAVPLAIATASGRLEAHDVPEPRDGRRAIVLCPASAAGALARGLGPRARVVPVPDDVADRPARLLEVLAEQGMPRVVCEGGGVLASRLLAAGAVDELDQTIAPIALSPGDPLLTGRVTAATATLVGLLRDGTDRLYVRWGFPRG